jgi:hypothetical protein
MKLTKENKAIFTLFVALITLLSCNYNSHDSLLTGTWFLKKIELPDTSLYEFLDGDHVMFNSDKNYYYSSEMNQVKTKGQWEMNEDTLRLLNFNVKNQFKKYHIEVLSKRMIQLKIKDTVFYYYKK